MPARNEITAAPTGAEPSTLYVAIEISRKSWVVGLKGPAGERIGLHSLAAADVEGLKTRIEHHRAKAERVLGSEVRVLCCYEAGYVRCVFCAATKPGTRGSGWHVGWTGLCLSRRSCWILRASW